MASGHDIKQTIDTWAAVLGGNFSLLDGISSPDCQVWHSSDAKWMPQREAMHAFLAGREKLGIGGFEDVRIVPTAEGFLCQTSILVEPVGRLHLVQVVTMTDGAISHVEEYIAPEMDLAALVAS